MSSSSSSKDISDYADAVDRIINKHVDPSDTSQDDIRRALTDSDVGPQVTDRVVNELVGSVLSEERVIGAIESSGELPSEGEIDAITDVSDDYDMKERRQEVADAIRDRVATQEDVRSAIEISSGDGPTYREDVERGIDSVSENKELVGSNRETEIDRQAEEYGAPREAEVQRARLDSVGLSDGPSPSEVLGDRATEIDGIGDATATQATGAIRDTDGNIQAIVDANRTKGSAVAEELGVEYQSASDVAESFDLQQSRGKARLTYNGETVREFDT